MKKSQINILNNSALLVALVGADIKLANQNRNNDTAVVVCGDTELLELTLEGVSTTFDIVMERLVIVNDKRELVEPSVIDPITANLVRGLVEEDPGIDLLGRMLTEGAIQNISVWTPAPFDASIIVQGLAPRHIKADATEREWVMPANDYRVSIEPGVEALIYNGEIVLNTTLYDQMPGNIASTGQAEQVFKLHRLTPLNIEMVEA